MPGPGGRDFQQSYNCQAVADSAHQVIVAARATDQASDKGQAVSMIEETILNAGTVPKEVSADAGYYSAKEVEELYALGVDPFVAPEKTRHGWVPPPAPRGRIPKGLSARDRMRRKLPDPSRVGSVTGYAWRRWNRYSARSSRAGVSGSSCCVVWRR